MNQGKVSKVIRKVVDMGGIGNVVQLSFSDSPTVALTRLLLESTQECNAVRHSCVPPHPTDIRLYRTLPPPLTICLCRFDLLAWSSGSDQRRNQWLRDQMACLLGRIHFPLMAMSCMCFCVAEVFFLFSQLYSQGA